MNILSTREKEVLHLIAYEHTASEIAAKLYISPHTVTTHRKSLLRKLNVKNIAGMVRVGFEQGVLGSLGQNNTTRRMSNLQSD